MKNILKRLWVCILIVLFSVPALSQEVKTIRIPSEIKTQENFAKEIIVKNLSEEEIYRGSFMNIIDNSIYLVVDKPIEVIKLSLQGKVVKRAGKVGAGPAEYIWIGPVMEFKNNIAVLDDKLEKIVFYNKNLDFTKETRFLTDIFDFIVDKNNRFIFFGSTRSGYYFEIFSEKGTFIKRFGKTVSATQTARKKDRWDDVRHAIYVPEENGIWASFINRYDLRYYKDERLAVEVKAKKDFFKGEKEEIMGKVIVLYHDRSLGLGKAQNRLYSFYLVNKKTFCDVFDLTDYRLIHRIKFKYSHRLISHYKENIFYSLSVSLDEENLLLLKIVI